MKNMVCIVVLCLFAGLISCGHSRAVNDIFQQAEKIMAQQPDSVLALLSKVENVNDLSAKDKAMYYLLLTEAEDKTYTKHMSDSLIAVSTEYFDKSDDLERKAKAWYYRGRVNQDLGDAPHAQDYYLKALQDEDKLNNYALLGRIYNKIGMLCTFQNVYEQAIPYQENALKYFSLIGDSVGQSFVLRDIGRVYSALEEKDSAIIYYQKALSAGKSLATWAIYSELGDLYMAIGKYPESYECLWTSLNFSDDRFSLYSTYLTLGELYLNTNKLDSAEYYLNISLESPKLITQAGAFLCLSKLEKQKANWKQAVLYYDQYDILSESLIREKQTESIRKYQSLYSYYQVESKLTQTRLEVAKLENWRLTVGLGALILVVAVVILYYILHTKKKHIQEQKEKLIALRKKQQEDKVRIEENDKMIDLLEMRLKESAVASDEKEKELILLRKRRLEIENQNLRFARTENILLVEKFCVSDVYFRFHLKEEWKPKDEDWNELYKALDEAYDNFTHRIMGLYKDLTTIELRICCLVKANVPPATMAMLLVTTATNVSMIRKRLYEKINYDKGSAEKFDNFIWEF